MALSDNKVYLLRTQTQAFILLCIQLQPEMKCIYIIEVLKPNKWQRTYCNLLSKKERRERRGEGREGERTTKQKWYLGS